MLKFELIQTDEHSTSDLLPPKNLRFSSRTNLIKNRCASFEKTLRKEKMKKNKSLIIGIIFTILIIYLASTYKNFLDLKIEFIPNSFGVHSILLLSSIIVIYLFRKQVNYRIKLPKFKTLLKPIGLGLLVSLLSAMIMGIVITISGGESSSEIKMPASNLSLLQKVIFVFFYASIAEEILFRGFLLNILKSIREKGISMYNRKISFGVLISSIMFGLFHIFPFKADNNIIFTIGMVTAPTLLGIVAGYYQEKYDNNAYALIVHMAGNLLGIIGVIVMSLNS